jgi:protoporphyrinogen/coproporphyrinogen III oxidase
MSARDPYFVLGAGFAGLVAAVELTRLGHDVVVLEASDAVGGLATSHRVDGVSFDTGAHFVTNRLATALGVMDHCDDAARYGEAVWHRGRSAAYPLGLMRDPRFSTSAFASRLRAAGPVHSAADRFRAEYGRALADDVAIPLVEAWSGLPGEELAPSVVDKIPGGIGQTLALTAARRLTHRAVAIGYCAEAPQSANVWHVYPRDGLDVFVDSLAARLDGHVRLRTPVEAVVLDGDRVVGVRAGGATLDAAGVISTLPAPLLPRLVDHPGVAPLAQLRFRAMVFLQLRLRGRDLLPEPVTWFPDRALDFFRVTEAPMAMPWLAPPGETVLTVDFGAAVGDAIWEASEEELVARAEAGLLALIPDLRRRYLARYSTRTPIAYPVYARTTEAARLAVHAHGITGLASAGRNAEFAHLLMEDVYWRTLRTTRALAPATTGPQLVAG